MATTTRGAAPTKPLSTMSKRVRASAAEHEEENLKRYILDGLFAKARDFQHFVWPTIRTGLWLPFAVIEGPLQLVTHRLSQAACLVLGVFITLFGIKRTLWPALLWISQVAICAYTPGLGSQLELKCRSSHIPVHVNMTQLQAEILNQHRERQDEILTILTQMAQSSSNPTFELDRKGGTVLEESQLGLWRARQMDFLCQQSQATAAFELATRVVSEFEDLTEELQIFITRIEHSVKPILHDPRLDTFSPPGLTSFIMEYVRPRQIERPVGLIQEARKALQDRVLEGSDLRSHLRNLRTTIQFFENTFNDPVRGARLAPKGFFQQIFINAPTRVLSLITGGNLGSGNTEEQRSRIRAVQRTLSELWYRFDNIVTAVARKRVQLEESLFSATILAGAAPEDVVANIHRLRQAVQAL